MGLEKGEGSMAEGKKKSMAVLVSALVLFIAGLILGYYVWGLNRPDQVDYKAFLQETINYIATLEHKNKKLLDTVDVLETEISMLQEKQATGSEQRSEKIDALSERIAVLERENREMAATVSDNRDLARENQELKQKLQALMDQVGMEKSESFTPEHSAPDAPSGMPPGQ